jgi:hypothetical protein
LNKGKLDGGTGEFRSQDHVESQGYAGKRIRIEVRATSGHVKVNVASMPAVPLSPK